MFNIIHKLAARCQFYFYRAKRYVSPEASVFNSTEIYPWSAVRAISSEEFVIHLFYYSESTTEVALFRLLHFTCAFQSSISHPNLFVICCSIGWTGIFFRKFITLGYISLIRHKKNCKKVSSFNEYLDTAHLD